MGSKSRMNKAKKSSVWKGVGISMAILLVLGLAGWGTGLYSISGSSDDNEVTGLVASVNCQADYSKTFTLTSKNFYDKTASVDTDNSVVYKVFLKEGEVVSPQADLAEGDELVVLRGQSFDVIASVNGTADVQNELKTFAVEANCDASVQQSFYVKSVPASITARVDNIDIDGAMATDNLMPIVAGSDAIASATFTGASDTAMNAIIVIDADVDIIDDLNADLTETSTPSSHRGATINDVSYAFELGAFEESTKVFADFTFVALDDAQAGDYNMSYTIYQKQAGYVDSDTGLWVAGSSVEDDNKNVLLPTYTGTFYATIV